MFKPWLASYVSMVLLAAVAGVGCGDAGGVVAEMSTGTTTSPASSATDGPTTGASAASPTTTATTTDTTSGASEAGASEADTGGASTVATTGGVSGCGDGVVDPGEECDDFFTGNDDSRYCTADCTLNVCGDGKLFVGWELCDEGEGNSDAYGNVCDAHCAPGARCGDSKVQPEFETCDLGANNGGMKGDEQGILCDASCRAHQLRGFVTAATFSGDLGGFFGADLKCQAAAAAAALPEPERFHALVSSGDTDAKTRFKAVAAALPYVLVTGKKFADNFPALMASGPLGEGISATETGATMYKQPVASNTSPGGVSFSPDQHCQAWTSGGAIHQARAGFNAMPADDPEWPVWQGEQWWLSVASFHCDTTKFHLYCLEI